MKRPFAIVAALAVAVLSLAATAAPAEAHERRSLGPYQVIVGWLGEPAFAGVTNAVDLRVTDARSTPAKPVEGLEKTLTVEVFQGGSTTPFSAPFRTRSGNPGAYAADIVPTREGSYRFVVKGKIESQNVNETFESGPGRFDEIRPMTALQYPDKVPAGAELARALEDIRSTADQTRLIAIAALVLGAIAVALSFIRGRRRMLAAALALAMLTIGATADPGSAAPLRDAFFASSDPAPNARLAASPARIAITFTDALDVGKSSIALLRSDGSAISLPPPQPGATHEQMVVTVATPIAPGVYAVRWKSVSEHDGHEQQGYFAFAVGADAPADLRGFALSGTAEGITAQLDVTPGRLGGNTYRVRTTAAGAAFVPEHVTLRFTPTALGVQSEPISLTRGTDALTGTGMELAIAGAYKISAGVRRAGATQDIALTFELTAPAQPAATPSPSPARTASPVPTASPTPRPTPAAAPAPADDMGSGPVLALVAVLVALAALGLVAVRRRRA